MQRKAAARKGKIRSFLGEPERPKCCTSRQNPPGLLSILGTVAAGYIGLIYVLVYVVIGGIKDEIRDAKTDIKAVKTSIDKLDESFRGAYKAAIDVNDSDLVKSVANLNKTVVELKTGQTVIENKLNNLQPSPYDWQDIKMQLNNMQRQIHTIPGVQP
jgi:hypothetical protein